MAFQTSTAIDSTLNPSADAFYPPQQWTIMNRPIYSTLCRYHCHVSGNQCHFGNACWFVHAQELHRPTFGEQTASLLQAVHSLILFAVSCLQLQAPAMPASAAAQTVQRDESVDDDDLKLNGEDLLSTEAKSEQSTPTNAFDTEPARQNLAGDDKQSDALDQALLEFEQHDDEDATDSELDNKSVDDRESIGGKPYTNILDAEVSELLQSEEETVETKTDTVTEVDAKINSVDIHSDKVEPIGGKPFEDIIEAKVETKAATKTTVDAKSTANDFIEAKIDTSYALSPKKTEQLWTFVLANNPHALVAKYPKLRKQYVKLQYLGKMDAILVKLKKTELNGKPVIIRGRVKNRGRFIVEFHDYSKSPKSLRIKDENLQTLKPRPTLEAFSIFKSDIEESSWAILTVNDSCFHNDNILYVFLSNQFPFYDGDVAENPKLKKLCVDTVKMAKAKGMGVTQRDCPKIISLLYCLAFNRKIHIVRIFQIPSSWTPQLWSGEENLFVLLPTKS